LPRNSAFPLFAVLFAELLRAQSTGASLTGRITDPSGFLVVDAALSATSASTGVGYKSKTNNAGVFYFTNLPPGSYRLEVEKTGFRKLIKPEMSLHVQDTLEIDFTMTLGTPSDSITVEAGSPLLTESGTVSTVVDRQFVENLPLNGRSFQNLLQLTPGAVVATTSFYDQGQFNINGQRADANYFTVDGVSANFGVAAAPLGQAGGGALPSLTAGGGFNGLVSVDAVQEIRIQTSSFSPEFGRMPGGQINISTRSGGNQFHGALFDYFRNDKLDANDWFANQQRKPKPEERQNDFGGVLGGPIVKNHTFFFISYEGLRLRQPQVAIAGVPDLAVRQGAPAVLQPILAAYPIPNGPELRGGLAQYSASISTPTRLDAGSARIDHTFGKVSLFGRVNDAPSSAISYPGAPMAPSNVNPTEFDSLTATAGATWLISPSSNNDFRFNYSRSDGYSSLKLTNLGGAVPLNPSLVFPSFSNPETGAFTFVCCSFGSEIFLGENARNRQRQFNVVDSFAFVTGAHQLKFGIDRRNLSPTFGRRAYDNQYIYANSAAVLANAPSEVFVDAASGAAGLRVITNNNSAFAQDTWRASRRLTMTYGLRWEYNPAPHVANRAVPWVVNQITDLATTQLVSSGAPLWHASAANFAPRFGIAYVLSDSSRWGTVLRGGAGVFYDIGFGQLGDVFADNAQYYGSTIYTSNVAFPLTPAQQTPPSLAGPTLPISQAAVFDPHLKLPYTVQWNIALEQRLGSDQAFTASYVGSAGRRLLLETYYSTPNPSFNALFVTDNGAASDYDALQLQFQRRLSHGLQALASYTWSHSIDTASSDAFILADSPGRASSSFDIRHSAGGGLSYSIPTPTRKIVTHSLLRDWSADSMNMFRTAEPITVISTSTFVGGSYTGVLPNLESGVPVFLIDPDVAGGKRINPAAFGAPPAGQNGNAPRSLLRGFGAWQSDLALRRQFSLSEHLKLQLRGEFFNLFNRPNFANPTSILTSPLFGISTATLGQSLGSGGTSGGFAPLYQIGGPRSIQLALKLQF
jgi:Carboxypeptidase regulatory-like domain/TonB-dependent Receptor Plug Domain